MRDYLKYYPEDKDAFNGYRDQVHDFTKQLHANYLSCYVRKEDPLRRFPYQYRTHMYELHQQYINALRANGGAVTKSVVIEERTCVTNRLRNKSKRLLHVKQALYNSY